jgi:hypothetical protein
MSSTLGGEDPGHDLSPEEKDKQEKKLREEARKLIGGKNAKERTRKLNRAIEISREKAKRAHQ